MTDFFINTLFTLNTLYIAIAGAVCGAAVRYSIRHATDTITRRQEQQDELLLRKITAINHRLDQYLVEAIDGEIRRLDALPSTEKGVSYTSERLNRLRAIRNMPNQIGEDESHRMSIYRAHKYNR